MKSSTATYHMRARAEAVEATRERLLDAGMQSFASRPYEEVTIAGLARDAGVSHQTLLNHFGSKEGLFLAVGEAFSARVAEQRGEATPGDARAVVDAVIRQYEALGDANARVAALNERIPTVAAILERARAYHQEWLAEMFGDRLPAAGAARREALAALHAATDVFTWKLLRRDLGLSRRATAEIMTRLVAGAVPPAPADKGGAG
jgi:AcrR family transcriptional regulator